MIKNNTIKIPIVYAFLYMNIKKHMRGNKIYGSNIKKIIQRTLLNYEGKGSKGLPKRYCHDIVKDLVELNLIEKIGKIGNNIAYQDNNDNMTEAIERLKDWKINDKIRENKEVKDKLKVALDILDEDPLYRVVKSQCDKQLRQSFWQ